VADAERTRNTPNKSRIALMADHYDERCICRRNLVITISEVHTVDDEIVDAFAVLIPQLSRSNPAPDAATLQSIADSEASTLLIARDEEQDDAIVGSMTLAMFRIPTGLRAWIEDVVVDERARGKGVGRILNERALEIANEAGATTVDLTSRPSREAANRLYQRLGFVQRETNVYRFTHDTEPPTT
jgi:ribosomal protein S18 acetylase RimI-like enzyme